jgi:LysM repeat protein
VFKSFFLFVVFKPLGFIFKYFFSRPLIRFYYFILKLKKGKTDESGESLFNEHHFYLILTIIGLAVAGFSLFQKAGPLSAQEAMQKTAIAHLVTGEFGSLDGGDGNGEEIVVESGLINKILPTRYTKNNSLKAKTKITTKLKEEELQEEIITQNQNKESLIQPNVATIIGKGTAVKKRKEIIEYIISEGDTISTIADQFGISVNTVLWANDLSVFSLIRPGDKLTILPVSGILYKVAKGDTLNKISNKYGIEVEKIQEINKLEDELIIGKTLIIPGGKQSSIATTTKRNNYSALSVIKDILKPSSAKPVSNQMNWPTVGHRITQYYSWRHKGLDIANKVGTPLYAADSGTVIRSGWNNGYGYNVVIDHGGGKKTLYGHASKLFVKAGDKVSKGETIALMGSTGWSTGPHIHFEVIINNVKYNPLNYIK